VPGCGGPSWPVIAAFDLGRKVGLVIGKRDSERAIIAMIEGRHERL